MVQFCILHPSSMVEYQELPKELYPCVKDLPGYIEFNSMREFSSYIEEVARKVEQKGFKCTWDIHKGGDFIDVYLLIDNVETKECTDVLIGFI